MGSVTIRVTRFAGIGEGWNCPAAGLVRRVTHRAAGPIRTAARLGRPVPVS